MSAMRDWRVLPDAGDPEARITACGTSGSTPFLVFIVILWQETTLLRPNASFQRSAAAGTLLRVPTPSMHSPQTVSFPRRRPRRAR